METNTLANDVLKTKLAGQIASSQSIKQKELEKVLSKMTKRNPVKEILELTEYASLERDYIKAQSSGDTEKQNQAFQQMKILETNEVLYRNHRDKLIVRTEASYQVAFNGASKHEKVKWDALRPRWFGWRQTINLKDEIGCDFETVQGTQNCLDVISRVLVSDILLQVRKYKDNSRVGDAVYSEKKEKLELVNGKNYKAWLHNEYNGNGAEYSPLKIQLIQNLAEGNFEQAFEDIDFVSLTQSERDQIINELTPKSKKEIK